MLQAVKELSPYRVWTAEQVPAVLQEPVQVPVQEQALQVREPVQV